MNSVMVMLKKCCAFVFLKKLQILYKENDDIPVIYVPIYGELTVWSKKNGHFGKVRLGNTAGEEALCDRLFRKREDNCFAETDAALVCISRDTWADLK